MHGERPEDHVLSDPTVWGGRNGRRRYADGRLDAYVRTSRGSYDQYSKRGPTRPRSRLLQPRASRQGFHHRRRGVSYEMVLHSTVASWRARSHKPAKPLRPGRSCVRRGRGQGRQAQGRPEGHWRSDAPGRDFLGDTNLGDPIVGPLVTKTAETFTRCPSLVHRAISRASRSRTPRCGQRFTAQRMVANCSGVQGNPVEVRERSRSMLNPSVESLSCQLAGRKGSASSVTSE